MSHKMQPLTRFLFTTVEGLALLALFVGAPVVLALMSSRSIRPLHVAVNAGLAVLFGVLAGIALSQVKQGAGMGGLLVLLVGCGAGLLALSFLAGALSTGVILLVKRDGQPTEGRTRSSRGGQGPSSPRLGDQYARWKATQRRPNATYQEFLEEAHPRYFPASGWTIAAAAVLMLVVAYLVSR